MKILAWLRSLIVTIFFPFTVIILGPVAILAHALWDDRDVDDAIVSFWGRLCCRMAGVHVKVEGLENLPAGGAVLLFNHSSFFDVFAMAGYLRGVRFGAKAELFKIPIFSHTMRALGTLPIARNNREEVFKIYEEARGRFVNGEKFALSPEGGRFHGAALSSFKAGPFIFAMSAGVPVVPVVIAGAYEALPKGGFLFNKDRLRHDIKIHILPPVPTAGYSNDTRRELQAVVFAMMNNVWVESQQNLIQD